MTTPQFLHFLHANSIEKHPMEIVDNKGGVDCKSKDYAGIFKIIGAFGKKVTGKVIKGKFNFSSMQRPTILSLPESHLQMLSHEFNLALEYFSMASQVTDDLARLKIIVAGIIGNMSLNVFRSKGKGPVNPTLGETFSVG